MTFIISIILFGAAAFACTLYALEFGKRRRGLKFLEKTGKKNSLPLLWKFSSSFSNSIAPRISKILTKRRALKTERLIVAAGMEGEISALDVLAAEIVLGLFGAVFSILVLPWGAIVNASMGFIAGYTYIMICLKRRAAAKREAIEIALPGTLDWLTLSVEAGLDFSQALVRITERLKNGPLHEEFERLINAMKVGVPRREALSTMAAHASVPALSSVAALLIQADRLGASIGPVLRVSAVRLRAARFSRAEKKGIAAAQKALLPLIFCIMPTTFIVIFGPLVARFLTGGFRNLF